MTRPEPGSSAGAEHPAAAVVVVGAGFSGLYLIHRLRQQGLDVQAIEKAPEVGGTWYWNRYPGARCDIESFDYSYSFSPELEQDWWWPERYSAQPEILAYLRAVADRFDLRRSIRFGTSVISARFDETAARWTIVTDRGDSFVCRYFIMATGCLSVPTRPRIAGMDDFRGPIYSTYDWPHDPVAVTGRKVAVIGTGSSAIQAIPILAQEAAELTVFQRTAGFVAPANNRPTAADEAAAVKRDYQARRAAARRSPSGVQVAMGTAPAAAVPAEDREAYLRHAWQVQPFGLIFAFTDVLTDPAANALVADYVRTRVREKLRDPAVAEQLCPKDLPIGSKRMCLDTNYYETFNLPNVRLVDISEQAIERFTADGLIVGGDLYRCDVVVLATGFDAMTGALLAVDIRGRDGRSLRQQWEAGPRTYLGLMAADFPNMFIVAGPGSPSVLTNMVMSIEQHVDWIADCLAMLETEGAATIEPGVDAVAGWVEHVHEIAAATLHLQANSWYLGANVPGKPRIFMPYAGGLGAYRDICDAVAAEQYRGFIITKG